MNTIKDGYEGTAKTTDSNVESIEATHDSSASVTRKTSPDRGSGGPDVEAEAVAELVGYTRIKLECSDTGDGDPPTAVNDGNNDLPVCSSMDPIDINVLDNDNDPNGDSLSIDNVSSQTNVSCQTISFPQISSDNCRGGVY